MNNPKFTAMMFRHSYNQITAPGGLWDTAQAVYGQIPGAVPHKTPKFHWRFRSGATVHFAHIARNEDVNEWQGSQIALICWDELTHFSQYQFFYMLSRNRSVSGVIPYVRATCNPDADSWVASFISWWIDQDSGYPIQERSGKIRWMVYWEEKVNWFDTREEAMEFAKTQQAPEDQIPYITKSVTFIASSVTDNQELLRTNPQYMANLLALPVVEKERLLNGNWKIRNNAGLMFKRGQVKVIEKDKVRWGDITQFVRGWDLAATAEDKNKDPAFTAGVLVGQYSDNRYIILDVVNERLSAGDVEQLIVNCAKGDRAEHGYTRTRLPQDPGQSGKAQSEYYIKLLASQGFDVTARLESGNKEHRATPVAALWQHGFIDVVEADWNNMYFSQLEGFPVGKFKDMVDATSSAFDELQNYMGFNIDNML